MEKKLEAQRLAIGLRSQGKSVKAIAKELSVSPGSISIWVRGVQLTTEQRGILRSQPRQRTLSSKKMSRMGNESKYHKRVAHEELTRERKARIAEAAILFRLALHDLIAYSSPFDGDKTDWLVENSQGHLLKVQLRWTKGNKQGLPNIPLRCSDGRKHQRRYNDNELDFMVGYDLYTDTAYVMSRDELKGYKAAISIQEEFAEAWGKLQ